MSTRVSGGTVGILALLHSYLQGVANDVAITGNRIEVLPVDGPAQAPAH